MIYLSNALRLALADDPDAALPIAGWQNLVTVSGIAADDEEPDHPASNLANPSTANRWLSSTTDDQYVTVSLAGTDEIDYLAVARHNFGTGLIVVSVETYDGADWNEVVEEHLPADDKPLLFRFVGETPTAIRLKLQPDAVEPTAAVLYVGKLLVFERGIQVGHVPLPFGRRRDVVNGRSESGEFLGQIQIGAGLSSSYELQNITPEWYREYLDPFLEAQPPFFFAWHPSEHEDEVGYAWLTTDAVPSLAHLAGYFRVTLQMDGLAL
jgi:hypothetical protein